MNYYAQSVLFLLNIIIHANDNIILYIIKYLLYLHNEYKYIAINKYLYKLTCLYYHNYSSPHHIYFDILHTSISKITIYKMLIYNTCNTNITLFITCTQHERILIKYSIHYSNSFCV